MINPMKDKRGWPRRNPDDYSSRRLSSIGGTITGLFSDLETGGQSWLSYVIGLLIAVAVVVGIGFAIVALGT